MKFSYIPLRKFLKAIQNNKMCLVQPVDSRDQFDNESETNRTVLTKNSLSSYFEDSNNDDKYVARPWFHFLGDEDEEQSSLEEELSESSDDASLDINTLERNHHVARPWFHCLDDDNDDDDDDDDELSFAVNEILLAKEQFDKSFGTLSLVSSCCHFDKSFGTLNNLSSCNFETQYCH